MGSENGGHGSVDRAKKGLKLFGVRIVDGEKWREQGGAARAGVEDVEAATKSMLKSLSMGNLVACTAIEAGEQGDCHQGYLSDGGLVPSSRRGGQERKRGVPWSEEEHRTFLAGLAKLGKGDWRGISRNYVTTRTPTQVASHAQKYFLRQSNPNKKKRRSSLFDVVINNKAAYLQNPPTSPLKKSEEAFNKLAISSSLTTTQAAFPGSSSCSTTSTLYNENSVADPTLSLNLTSAGSEQSVPSFLKLSLPLCPPQASTSSAPATNNDLELSIAPPQSHSSLAKLSTGTISVI